MARTKQTPPALAARIGPRSGLVKATFSLTIEQLEALRARAEERRPAGAIRADAGLVLREVLDAWIARSRRK